MTYVVDASVLVAALVDGGPAGRWAESQLAGEVLVAPHLVLPETADVLRRSALAGSLSHDVAGLAHGDLMRMSIELFPYGIVADRVWDLRHTVSAYDGCYVALAELLDAPLVTLDLRLTRASGPRCQFRTPAGFAGR